MKFGLILIVRGEKKNKKWLSLDNLFVSLINWKCLKWIWIVRAYKIDQTIRHSKVMYIENCHCHVSTNWCRSLSNVRNEIILTECFFDIWRSPITGNREKNHEQNVNEEHKNKNENRKILLLFLSFKKRSKSGSERHFKHLTAHQKSNVWKGLPCNHYMNCALTI